MPQLEQLLNQQRCQEHFGKLLATHQRRLGEDVVMVVVDCGWDMVGFNMCKGWYLWIVLLPLFSSRLSLLKRTN